jgi:hypothetical protein
MNLPHTADLLAIFFSPGVVDGQGQRWTVFALGQFVKIFSAQMQQPHPS